MYGDRDGHGLVHRSPTSLKASKGILRFRFTLQWLAIRSFLQGSEEWRTERDAAIVRQLVKELGEGFRRSAFPLLGFFHNEAQNALRVLGGVELQNGLHRLFSY